jgi:hypothetical protein
VCSGNKRDKNKRMKHLATRGKGNCTTSRRMIYKPSWSQENLLKRKNANILYSASRFARYKHH